MSVRWDVDRNQLFPRFGDSVHLMLAQSPHSWAVVQGFRSPAEQNKLWQKGRDANGNIVEPDQVVTAAKEFQSPHTVTNPLGEEHGVPQALAVDVARLDDAGTEHWDYGKHPAWQWLWDKVKASPDLHSGVDFPSPDSDHVQSLLWIHVKDQLKAMGKW